MRKAKTKKSISNNISLADLFPMTSCQSIDPSFCPALSFNPLTDAFKPLADSITVPEFKTGVLKLGNICDKNTDEEANYNVFDMDDAHMKIIETAPEKIVMKVANQLYVDHDSIITVGDKLNKAMKRLVKIDKAKSKISVVITLAKVIPVLDKAVKTALFIARACAVFEVTKSPVSAFIKAFKLKKTDILVELFEAGMKSLAERLKAKGEPELKAAEVTDHISLIDKVMADLENSINDAEKKKED